MAVHGRGVSAGWKGDGSPVTEADRRAEAIILPALRRLAPDIPIISEENTDSHLLTPAGAFFLVDPLDGTREFIKTDGQGAFTVNIALIQEGQPVLGVVHAPAHGRCFAGLVGVGAWQDRGQGPQPIHVRPCATPPVALVSSSHQDPETMAWLAARGITDLRPVGSSLKFALLAAAEADIYPRFGPTSEWDTAAGDAVLRAAGGRVTFSDGRPFTYGKPRWKNGAFIACGGMSAPTIAPLPPKG